MPLTPDKILQQVENTHMRLVFFSRGIMVFQGQEERVVVTAMVDAEKSRDLEVSGETTLSDLDWHEMYVQNEKTGECWQVFNPEYDPECKVLDKEAISNARIVI